MKYKIPLRLPRHGAFVRYCSDIWTNGEEKIVEIYGELYPYDGTWWYGIWVGDEPYNEMPCWIKNMREIYWEFDIPYEEYM